MSWLRIDDGFAANPKIAQLTDRELRIWLRLLCYCARHKDPTVDRAVTREVPELTTRRIANFARIGLLDPIGETHEVHDWTDYQPKDSTGAERQERWRARRNQAKDDRYNDRYTNRDVNSDETVSRARVPVPSLRTTNYEASSNYADDDLAKNIKALNGTPGQQVAWLTVARAEPDRVRACLAAAVERGSNPASYFATLVSSGEWPKPRQGAARANVVPADPVEAIRRMVANGVIVDRVDLEVELRGAAFTAAQLVELRALLPDEEEAA